MAAAGESTETLQRLQVGSRPELASSVFGVSGIIARCSFSQMYKVINGFDEEKRRLVEQIGFGGLLYFPPLKQIDRRFIVWLMCLVDEAEQMIVIDDSRKLKLSKLDVGRVFGIPSSGRMICRQGRPLRELVNKITRSFLGLLPKENRSIKAAHEVIVRQYVGGMTYDQTLAFKAAFVIYAMSTLLVPGAKHDYLGVDYWRALEDPDQIHLYDWSDFVFKRLLVAVAKMKSDLSGNFKMLNISGCFMFLLVLYLDSIDVSNWCFPHNCFPRMRVFSAEVVKNFIRMETIIAGNDQCDRMFGKNMIRSPVGVCYSWAGNDDGAEIERDNVLKKDLRAAISAFVRVCRLPPDVALKVYNLAAGVDNQAALTIFSSVVYAMKDAVPGISRAEIMRDESGVGDISDDEDNFNGMDKTAMDGAGVSGELICSGKRRRVDSMKSRLNFQISGSSVGVGVGLLRKFEAFVNGKLIQRCAVVHLSPTYIEVTFGDLKDQILGVKEVEADLFDAFLRVFKQNEYRSGRMVGTVRSFLESDLTGSVLDGSFDVEDNEVRQLVIDSHVPDNFSNSSMLFIPFFLKGCWRCYVCVRSSNEVVIFESSVVSGRGCGTQIDHVDTFRRINSWLEVLAASDKCCWSYKMDDVNFRSVVLSFESSRFKYSGLCCAYFCRNYQGGSFLSGEINRRSGDEVVSQLLDDLVHLEGNRGLIADLFGA